MKLLIYHILLFNLSILWGEVAVEFGEDVPKLFKNRFLYHLKKISNKVDIAGSNLKNLEGKRLYFSIGSTGTTNSIIGKDEIKKLSPEGFIIKSRRTRDLTIIALSDSKNPKDMNRRGLVYGIYTLLERLGMSYYHPYEAIYPEKSKTNIKIDLNESPGWDFRGIHVHTMHPIELTEFLNGWGASDYKEDSLWEIEIEKFKSFLEWMLFHRLNAFEWVLLDGKKWKDFSTSDTRLMRLTKIVKLAHSYGIKVGIDVPIVLRQQNAWVLIEKEGSLKTELSGIEKRLDWVLEAGFDFISTELGLFIKFVERVRSSLKLNENLASHIFVEFLI